MNAGLVSITFRRLAAESVIDLAITNGLSCVEWGGDVHVPVGDLAAARRIGRQCREAGLRISSYGSYYWLEAADPSLAIFSSVLETALELGSPEYQGVGWSHSAGGLSFLVLATSRGPCLAGC